MKRDWLSIMIIAASIIVSVAFYPSLPEEMAVHWNVHGEPDDYMNKLYGAFLIPLLMIVMLSLFRKLPNMDPKKENYKKFRKSYDLILILINGFLFITHIVMIGFNLGLNLDISIIIPICISLLFILIGNFMPKFKHNYFVGIKTPWTLASEEAWVKTHRFSGKVFVLMGILLMLTTFLDGTLQYISFLSIVIGGVLLSIGSSYVFYKRVR